MKEEEQPDEGFVMHTLPVPKPEAKNRRDSMLGLPPAERMKRVIQQATGLSQKSLQDILAPILRMQQKWIQDLTALCNGSKDVELQEKAQELEHQYFMAMKPDLRTLTLYESFIHT